MVYTYQTTKLNEKEFNENISKNLRASYALPNIHSECKSEKNAI